VTKEKKRWSEVKKSKPLDEEIEEDRPARKTDHGKISKRKNPSVDALDHLAGKKEREAGKALKSGSS
jgi:hypothetical protein